MPETALPGSPARAGWLTLLLLLRLLTLLISAELSGLAHLTFDACELAGDSQHELAHDDCEDGPGHECPPGCLNCHCAHAAVVVAALRLESSGQAFLMGREAATFPSRARSYPSCSDRESIYRPPRSIG